MSNSLGRDFHFGSLLKFAFPTIIMMVFMSMYTMVDGVFVSRFVGTTALSAVNIFFPLLSVVIATGIMLATGASAIIAKELGEGNEKKARKDFSFIVLVGFILGVIFSVVGFIFLDPLVRLLGASGNVVGYCCDYALVLLMFVPCGMLQMLFQNLFVTAGKPYFGLCVTILGGVSNIVLDYVFIVPMEMGISGAALATGIGYSIPAFFGLVYFAFFRKGTLYFVVPKFDGKVLLKSCTNGSSEMVVNLSMAVTTFLFNILMMQYAGADGVAAITIVLYAQYLLVAVFLGYATGTAPIFSFNYGSENIKRLKRLFKSSLIFVLAGSVVIFVLSIVFAPYIVTVFAPAGTAVFDMSVHGFYLFSVSFLFSGVSIFASSLFTAFSDGRVSATISFLRTFVFIVLALLLLPLALGIDGIWIAIPVAEFLGFLVSVFLLVKKKGKYKYA